MEKQYIYARWEEQGDEERALLRKYGQFEVRSNAAHTHTPANAYYVYRTVTKIQRID